MTKPNGERLAAFSEGCKAGVILSAEAKAPAAVLAALPADSEFSSADAALRAVIPRYSSGTRRRATGPPYHARQVTAALKTLVGLVSGARTRSVKSQ
jgi:hypothetical protein